MDKQYFSDWYDISNINLESLYYESYVDTPLINSTSQSNTISNLIDKSLRSYVINEDQNNVVNSENIVTNYSSTPAESSFNPDVKWINIGSAFRSSISSHLILNTKHLKSEIFLSVCEKLIGARIIDLKKFQRCVKINFTLVCTFENVKSDVSIYEEKNLTVKNKQILPVTSFSEEFINEIKSNLLETIEKFQDCNPGFALTEIKSLEININDCTPSELTDSITVASNIPNNNKLCFFSSVTAALYRQLLSNSVPGTTPSDFIFQEIYSKSGIRYPTLLHHIPKIEEVNNLSINVYGFDENKFVVPIYLSQNYGKSIKGPCIRLLASQNKIDMINGTPISVHHYSSITNLSHLVSNGIYGNCNQVVICDRCLNHFSSQRLLDNHLEDCIAINKCRISFPKDDCIQFTNHLNKQQVPFVVYADLKCSIKPTGEDESKLIPCSIAFYVHCTYDNSKSNLYFKCGQDCIDCFSKELHKLSETFADIINDPVPNRALNNKEINFFHTSNICYMCDKPFTKNHRRIPIYCHFTGKFCGPAHHHCYSNYKINTTIPIVFHNLSAYNSHLIIKSLSSSFPGPISVLPIDKEKYISFTKTVKCEKNISSVNIASNNSRKNDVLIKLQFIDSFLFIEESLSKLSSYLHDSSKILTRTFFSREQLFKLVAHKGVFPYEYFDSWNTFEETQLPDEKWFYSSPSNSDMPEDNYKNVEQLWSYMKFKTLKQCYSLYLRADVLLLADIFENFRKECLFTYDLDPLYYHTASELAFDAMLKCTGVKLDLLKDPEMLLFIEKGIRGGITERHNRITKAHNKPITDCNSEKEKSYLMHYEIKNLYKAAMCSHLPYSSFEWETNYINVMNIPDDSLIGYIFEVDLEYPQSLFQLHQDLPLCSGHFIPPNFKESQCISDLCNKTKYVIYYKTLKQCLNLGLKLVKVHRILKFKQSQWLKPFIDLNINMREYSPNKFKNEFYELMNNAVYGETIKNVRKQKKVRIISWEEQQRARSYIALPNFNSSIIYDENLIAVELDKMNVVFNKPIYLGLCILDTLKNYVYDFHYNCILKNFSPNQAKLMYVNSEHLIYHSTVPNIPDYASQIMYKLHH